MSQDMSEIINSFKNMVDNGGVPDNIKEILSNLKPSDSDNSSNPSNNQSNNPQISPEAISSIMGMLNNNSNSSSNSGQSNTTNNSIPNIDIGTLMKMKSMMDKVNSKDDPRANLLLSLKPYLKESRKGKVEQYVQLFNMSKIMDVFGKTGGEKK